MSNNQSLSSWPALRWPWLLLAFSAFTLEIIALYFQYGLDLEPCVMCIYQRTAVFAILVSSLAAAYAPTSLLVRLVGFSGWGIASIWGLIIAQQHVAMQDPENFMLLLSCDAFPNFPTWLALHEWIPAFFEARGMCGDIDWSFMDRSMPQWMTVIFSFYSLTFLLFLINRLITEKKI